MKEKVCKKCGRSKLLDEYYAHPEMADGRLNICRECIKSRVSDYAKTSRGRENEKRRRKSEKRKRWVKKWLPGYYKKNKKKILERQYLWAQLNKDSVRASRANGERRALLDPERKKKIYARRRLRWHVKRGNVVFERRCEVCGRDTMLQFHHEDYNKPLVFMVLCIDCHKNLHKSNKKIIY
jgi:ribosome-binding protein aMBF1 (putative translation factor)